MFYIGKVESLSDEFDGERIKARIKNVDDRYTELPYAFPLLPKTLHVKPKIGEAVIIFCVNDNPQLQRFYLGPIISQYQEMYQDNYELGALRLLGRSGDPDMAVSNIPKANGAFATDEDIAIYGRKNSDIILGDSDVRIRCGAHLTDNRDTTDIAFNKTNPSFIKLKYHETPISVNKKEWRANTWQAQSATETVESSVNLVGQEINLISIDGDPYINTSYSDVSSFSDKNKGNEGLSDDELKKFIENAHPMVYGDRLIEFLHTLITAFNNHTHKYSQLPPVQDSSYTALQKYNLNDFLSKNIRIN
jgi:hypothetical protein